ncbi:MAG: alpha/beta hydrolase [Oligoflexales bacterium]
MVDDKKASPTANGSKPVGTATSSEDKFRGYSTEDFSHESFSVVEYDDDQAEPQQDDNAPKTQVFSCPVDHDGTSVFVKCWFNPNATKPPIIIAHGLGESVSQYRTFAAALHKLGFNVFSFDMRGHGRSGAMLGHVGDFKNLVSDILQVVSWVRFKSNRKKPYVIAQGIGALTLLYFAKQYPGYIAGAVMVSPLLLEQRLKVPAKVLIRSMAELFPNLRLPRKFTPTFLLFGPDGMSTTTTQQKLGYFGITSIFAREILNALQGAQSLLNTYKLPTLFLCPTKDDVCDYEMLEEIIEKNGNNSLFELKKVERENHYLLRGEEADVQPVLEVIVDWLNKKSAGNAGAGSAVRDSMQAYKDAE